jgi:hypothetical protein
MAIKNSKNPSEHEYKFSPRIINPKKIENAIIFSADEKIRNASHILADRMPWLKAVIFGDPVSVAKYRARKPTVIIFDDMALSFTNTNQLRNDNRDIVIVLLSSNGYIQCSPPSKAVEKYPFTDKADLVFGIDDDDNNVEKTIVSAIRCAEDKLNIEKYSKARRYIFLIVEDEPRWFSQFVTVLYDIIGQRADVMLTRTYEETLQFLFDVQDETDIHKEDYRSHGRGDDVVCIITDMFFPKGKNLKYDAGKEIIELINTYYPRIPIMIASKARKGYDLKDFAFVMAKGESDSLQTLRGYVHDFTGMGDFLILDESGKTLYRISNIREMYRMIEAAELESEGSRILRERLEYYGDKDFFSTWLYMHGYRELADRLRPKRAAGRELVSLLKTNIKKEIGKLKNMPLSIDGIKVYTLQELLLTLRSIDPVKIQSLSNNDIFSIWLDKQGYNELAGEFRPIHGSGDKLKHRLIALLEKWVELYQRKGSI